MLKQLILQKREKLFNRIAKRYKIPISVKLVPKREIFDGAQGCFEGDVIKIRRSIPLFWQLLVLEHEIGHFWAKKQKIKPKRKTFRIYRKKKDEYEEEEIKAWEWVEDHPIQKGSIIDQELEEYLKEVAKIGKKSDNFESCLRWAFWF